MGALSVSQIDFVAVLKYGAIGISLVCLLTAFYTNQNLAKRAAGLPQDTLDKLLGNARFTMKFSFACLIAAIVIETISHFTVPITVRIGIVPANLDSDAKRMRSFKDIAEPVHLQVAADSQEVELKNGAGTIRIAPNATLVVYVDGLWSAVKDLDGIVYGQQQRANGAAGTLEPRQ